MNRFKIVPLSTGYLQKIKVSMKDDFGHTVIEETATGRGPCRVSLKPFVPGRDRRLVLSHSPFNIDNAFNQTGPIFINAGEVEEYSDIYRFPPEIKADKAHFRLTLIGYNEQQRMVYSKLVGDRDIDDMIVDILDSKPEISYLHARNAEAGCYICRIERADE
jgi:hypothetical protein